MKQFVLQTDEPLSPNDIYDFLSRVNAESATVTVSNKGVVTLEAVSIKPHIPHKAAPNVCDICGREFMTHSGMLIHRTQVHVKQEQGKKIARRAEELARKPAEPPELLSCPGCYKKFANEEDLAKHAEIHVREDLNEEV